MWATGFYGLGLADGEHREILGGGEVRCDNGVCCFAVAGCRVEGLFQPLQDYVAWGHPCDICKAKEGVESGECE